MRENSIVLVLAQSHICVTNRSGLVFPQTPPPPRHALTLSQFAWIQSQGATGWMLGNRGEEKRRESHTAQSRSKNHKKIRG